MNPESIAALKKLMRGKTGLSLEDVLAISDDLRRTSRDELRSALETKPKSKGRGPVTKPDWLLAMELAKSRLRWSASESVHKLVQVAADEGLIEEDILAGKKKTPSFQVVAKKIAANDNGERLCRVFVREVDRIEREYRLG